MWCVHNNVVFVILPPVASAPTNLMAVQEVPTSIRVSWSPPTPLGDTTGYRIYYSGGSSGSEDVSGGSTDNYLMTGLQNGESYTISIVTLATTSSQLLPSDTVTVNIGLGIYAQLYNPSCRIHGCFSLVGQMYKRTRERGKKGLGNNYTPWLIWNV